MMRVPSARFWKWFGVCFYAALLLFLLWPVGSRRLTGGGSLEIYSSEGTLLRRFQSGDGSFAQRLAIGDYPPALVQSVLAAEDRRFFFHAGCDPLAIVRAAWQNLRARRIVSGGSTITQQMVRIAYAHELPRSGLLRKCAEIPLALRLELHFSKKSILEAYLNRVPLSENSSGFASASLRVLGRDPRLLSTEDCIALVVLTRQNSVDRDHFIRRFTELARRTGASASGAESMYQLVAGNSGIRSASSGIPADHYEQWVRSLDPSLDGRFNAALSSELTAKINAVVKTELAYVSRYDAGNAAVVVLRNPRHEGERLRLVSMVGSKDFSGGIDGQVNGAVSLRVAGSTLKPLIYALAMDRKNYTPHTLLDDRDVTIPVDRGETYRPRNYDLSFWGPMTLREALAASRNVPAVVTACEVGIPALLDYLRDAGFSHLQESPDFYGPGLALGTGGATLLQLARAYSGFACGGVVYPLYVGSSADGSELILGDEKELMSERTAWKITHILADREARRRSFGGRNFLDFPFDVAAKTGTSKDYRDSWTVGYTPEYTVAVWVGNFSGTPMKEVSGGWGAGRIFHQVMRTLADQGSPQFRYPADFMKVRLCRRTGLRAADGCPSYIEICDAGEQISVCRGSHAAGDRTAGSSDGSPVIVSPVSGESFILDPLSPQRRQTVPLSIRYGGVSGVYTYCIDASAPRKLDTDVEAAIPASRGEHTLELRRNGSECRRVVFTVE
jgi:penicillin-binding protein 1C